MWDILGLDQNTMIGFLNFLSSIRSKSTNVRYKTETFINSLFLGILIETIRKNLTH